MTSMLMLALVISATPHAPPDADALYVPRLDALPQWVPFLDQAGERSVFLRREGWRDEVHPLVQVDLTRPDSVLDAGLDPAGPYTLFSLPEGTGACAELKDQKRFQTRAAERLLTLGTPATETKNGVTQGWAVDPLGRSLGAYAIKGKTVCAVRSTQGRAKAALPALVAAINATPSTTHWKRAKGLPGQAVLISKYGVVGVGAHGRTATLEAKSAAAPVVTFKNAGPSPFAGMAPKGVLVARLRTDAQGAATQARVVAKLVGQVSPRSREALEAAVTAIAPALSGNALVWVRDVRVKGSLRSITGRLFAPRGVMLAELKDVAAVKGALAALAQAPGAKPLADGEGVSILVQDGELTAGVRGSVFFLANDGAAREAAFQALPKTAGTQAHGAELELDAQALAKGLAQVPLFDAMGSPELAGVLALSVEAGPLLESTEKLSAWVDSDGLGHKGQLTWSLTPKPSTDAGP